MAIDHPSFLVEPWAVRETELDLEKLAQTESVFALANGHLGLRANLDEGEPAGLPGTYLAGFYEERPLPYAEAGYGYPEEGQTVVNVTDGKVIRLLVEDEPFDIRYGKLERHRRVLDLRAGTLDREVIWESPIGSRVRVRSTRMVSFKQRAVAAIRYEVQALDQPLSVVLQSELITNQPLPEHSNDPRAAAALADCLICETHIARELRAGMVHRTRGSGLRMGAAMTHAIEYPGDGRTEIESIPDLARMTLAAEVSPGQPLVLVKFLAYGWSAARSTPAIRDQVIGALAGAERTGWEGLVAEQREFLDGFWATADVELEGDAELQQAIRFALFHTLQAGARGEQRAIPAKGLTGPGYDGHTFWDTESFVLPVLTYTRPRAVGDALRWRYSTLDLARERASQLGLAGAAFPWRTIRGQECSGYWPAGTAAFHINADIADAAIRYMAAHEDEEFSTGPGLELLVESARLWRSLGHHDAAGRFRIDGVTGPDEYSAICDNNVYTNLMAQQNLLAAADLSERHPGHAKGFGVDDEETAAWRDAARAMTIPYDEALRVHPQAEDFTQHQRWDFAATGPEKYPLLLHYSYFDLYRKQVTKQADLVLAMHLRGDAFDLEQKSRNFDYYEPLTVRDSSLSASTQAVLAAEVGHLELAFDLFGEAALMDLDDLEHNTRDGIHIASLAGTWIAAVAGFGGMRDHGGTLTFAPRLPAELTRLAFRLSYRGRRLLIEVRREHARYELLDGEPLPIAHHGEPLRLTAEGATRKIPKLSPRPAPGEPPGRRPARRRTSH